MRRPILSLFKRDAAVEQPTEQATPKRRRISKQLPPSVIAAVEAASVVVRSGSREDGPRAIVALPGRSGWTWSSENAANVLAAGWPDLTPGQIAQATARLSCLVHAQMQDFAFQSDPTGAAPDTRAWRDRF